MKDVDELKACIKRAKKSLDYMLKDAQSNRSDAAQAFMESAEDAQRQIMQAVTMVFIASQKQ